MLAGIVDHLWQSTLYAGGVAILAVLLRRSCARYRYWLWFSASAKFLVPFAWLENLGRRFNEWGWASVPSTAVQEAMPAVHAIRIGSAPAARLHLVQENWALALAAVWVVGAVFLLSLWIARWRQLRRIVRDSSPISGLAEIPVHASASNLEPGVIGILRPIVVFPRAILESLSAAEFAALLEHEKAHLKRRDNLLSLAHMLVEILFWFFPLVWWIGARLITERELACDQQVVMAGHQPRTYAEGILKACRLCLGSPMACAAGVSRNGLKLRVEKIASRQMPSSLNGPQKFLLALAAVATLLGPVGAGLMPQTSTAMLGDIARGGALLLHPAARLDEARPATPAVDHPMALRARHIGSRFVHLLLRRDAGPDTMGPVRASLPELPAAAVADVRPAAVVDNAAALERSAPPGNESSQGISVNTVTFGDPRGEGDPAGITCREPQQLPGSRMFGPKICLPNSRWASLRHRGLRYSAAGEIVARYMESPPADEGVRIVYVDCRNVSICGGLR